MEKQYSLYFKDEISQAQELMNNGDFEQAYNILYDAGMRDELLEPLIKEGEQLLRKASSGIFCGYGLPFDGRYDITTPGYIYLYIPQPDELLYEDNCYYMTYSEQELPTEDAILEAFKNSNSKLEYLDITYNPGFSSYNSPEIQIITLENLTLLLSLLQKVYFPRSCKLQMYLRMVASLT